MAAVKFLSDADNLLLDDAIEEVDLVMLKHLAKEKEDAGGMFVFLYDKDDGRATKIVRKLEGEIKRGNGARLNLISTGINDNLENDKVLLVKCSQEGAEDDFGVGYLPRLLHLESGIPVPYVGDLSNEGDVLRWIAETLKDEEVKEVTETVLERLTEKLEHVAVVFVDVEHRSKVVLGHFGG